LKPAAFDYHAAESVEDALALLERYGDDGRVLAGGQSLVPMMALRLARFDHLIDINRVEALKGVERRNGELWVGAGTRQCAIEGDETVSDQMPLLLDATRLIGHFQIRNRGTVGGSLAHADPAAEYAAVAVVTDATLEVAAPQGTRAIAASDFFQHAWTTALEPNELLLGVRFPVTSADGHAISEVARRHGDFALVGAVATAAVDEDDRVRRAAVALFGVGERPIRLPELEQRLVGARGAELDSDELRALARADLHPIEDVQASAAYRKQVAGPLVESVVRKALERAASKR
jgi:aerobic carbon-monoxide dehydrogenase medium subunit